MSFRNIRIPGFDGVDTVVDVTVPLGTGPFRTIVTRTPYGRAQHRAEGDAWAQAGYAYVVADVRGRYDSDGVWDLYRNERADGAALVDWIITQRWSDGRVIPFGGSYSGFTAWAIAAERPDAVAALVVIGPSMSLARTKFSPSGVLRLAEHAAWWSERADSRTSRDGHARTFFAQHPGALHRLPVHDVAEHLGAELPGWLAVIQRGPDYLDDERILDAEIAAVTVPTLHIGGWFDLLLPETLHQWQTVGSPSKRLIIGPWDHDLGFSGTTTIGDRAYGPASAVSIGRIVTTWLNEVLTSSREAVSTSRVFVLGDNYWREGTHWPDPTSTHRWLVHEDTLIDDATLVFAGSAVIRHVIDDPYPSYPAGHDRGPLGTRPDAFRADTPPLVKPLRIDGAVVINGYGTSTAEVADWIVRVTEQTSTGELFELASGETTTTHTPAPHDEPTPGAEFSVTLSPIAVTVPAGSRLGLEITAADFPRLARNIGLPGPTRYDELGTVTVTQRLQWTADHPLTVDIPTRPTPLGDERCLLTI